MPSAVGVRQYYFVPEPKKGLLMRFVIVQEWARFVMHALAKPLINIDGGRG